MTDQPGQPRGRRSESCVWENCSSRGDGRSVVVEEMGKLYYQSGLESCSNIGDGRNVLVDGRAEVIEGAGELQ